MTTIMGIRLDNRLEAAIEFQKILTEFGCIIRTRLGLHEASDKQCSKSGIIILEVIDDKEAKDFEKALCKIDNIEIQIMNFE